MALKSFKQAHQVLTYHGDRQQKKPQVAIAGTGANAEAAATRKLSKLTRGVSVLRALGENGERAKVAALQTLALTDHTHDPARSTVSLELEKEAIAEVVGGVSPSLVEQKYALSSGYVQHALRRRYGSPEAAKTALLGLYSEVALACGVKAMEEIPNMTGPQAVMSGAVAVDKVLALEKSIAERPRTIDFGALGRVEKTLKVLREITAQK